MRFIPRHTQAIGRVVVKRILSTLVRPDETKNTTKFVLIDGVGPGIHDVKVGDIVLPYQMGNIQLDGGVSFRPILDEKDIRAIVMDVTLDELVVQTDSGSHFVSFDDKDAARSLCENMVPQANGKLPVEARP